MKKSIAYITFLSFIAVIFASPVRAEQLSCYFSREKKVYALASSRSRILTQLSPESRIDFSYTNSKPLTQGWHRIVSFSPREYLDRDHIQPYKILVGKKLVPMYIYFDSSDSKRLGCVLPASTEGDPPPPKYNYINLE